MTNHKIKLTENEMETVRWALRSLLWHLENDMRPWTDFEEEPPEYMQEEFAKVKRIYTSLTDPF